jgi:dTDP-4-dehydrorhamnose reductase
MWRLRIPFDHVDSERNYLSKLMRYQRLLDATNSISHFGEFVAATFACWEKRIPFGIYNVTNPGKVTAREVVQLIQATGVCRKEFHFFRSEEEFMRVAAKTPRSNCVMDSTKLRKAGIEMTEVHDAIVRALKNWESSLVPA